MNQTYLGFVLKTTKYSETSVIVQVYTDVSGLESFIIHGVRSSKGNKAALLQPLSFVNLEAIYNPVKTIYKVKEISLLHAYKTIHFQQSKIAICIFLSEVLYKCLKISQQDLNLFHFIQDALIKLDDHKESYFADFHLVFLFKLLHHLGVQPISATEFYEIVKKNTNPALFQRLIDYSLTESYFQVIYTGVERRQLLDELLIYYQVHIDDFSKIKSLEIFYSLND